MIAPIVLTIECGIAAAGEVVFHAGFDPRSAPRDGWEKVHD